MKKEIVEKTINELLKMGKELKLSHGDEMNLACSYLLNVINNFNWDEVKDIEGFKSEVRRCVLGLASQVEDVLQGIKPNDYH